MADTPARRVSDEEARHFAAMAKTAYAECRWYGSAITDLLADRDTDMRVFSEQEALLTRCREALDFYAVASTCHWCDKPIWQRPLDGGFYCACTTKRGCNHQTFSRPGGGQCRACTAFSALDVASAEEHAADQERIAKQEALLARCREATTIYIQDCADCGGVGTFTLGIEVQTVLPCDNCAEYRQLLADLRALEVPPTERE